MYVYTRYTISTIFVYTRSHLWSGLELVTLRFRVRRSAGLSIPGQDTCYYMSCSVFIFIPIHIARRLRQLRQCLWSLLSLSCLWWWMGWDKMEWGRMAQGRVAVSCSAARRSGANELLLLTGGAQYSGTGWGEARRAPRNAERDHVA